MMTYPPSPLHLVAAVVGVLPLIGMQQQTPLPARYVFNPDGGRPIHVSLYY